MAHYARNGSGLRVTFGVFQGTAGVILGTTRMVALLRVYDSRFSHARPYADAVRGDISAS
jgi:hypothetical protein